MIKRTLYIANPVKLSIKESQLIIAYLEDSLEKKVPLEDIAFIVLENRKSLMTTHAMSMFVEHNIALITCNEKHMPSGLFLSMEGNSLLQERHRYQVSSSEPLRKQLWQQTVKMKIGNQSRVLKKHGLPGKKLDVWMKSVSSGDSRNHEGIAAAYYFDTLFSEQIAKFRRTKDGDSPNNALNYGYAIVRAMIARALVGSGLSCTLGIHHRNRYNAWCLADDIMEPFRPFVDDLVLSLMNSDVDLSELGPAVKMELLKVPAMDCVFEKETSPLMIAARNTAASLVKCYSGEGRKLLFPEIAIT